MSKVKDSDIADVIETAPLELPNLPKVDNKCRSSADEMNPLPSLSKCLRPSMKSSAVSEVLLLEIAWYMGRNTSKQIRSSDDRN